MALFGKPREMVHGSLHRTRIFASRAWNTFRHKLAYGTDSGQPSPPLDTTIYTINTTIPDFPEIDRDDNETIFEENTWERRLSVKNQTVIKRHISESEIPHRMDGSPMIPIHPQERLRNEAATLVFVARNTTIPVPKCRLYMEDNVLHLETVRIRDAITLYDLPESQRPAAVAAVDEQMQNNILPQLRKLRRNFVGSVDANSPVFPPSRLYHGDSRHWKRITSKSNKFVLCHNDLNQANIFIDPNTYRIVGIIDWEYAGFFPSYFELPLWRIRGPRNIYDAYMAVKARDLAFFGLRRKEMPFYKVRPGV